MKYSRFTVFCKETDKTILFNTLNKRMRVIPNSLNVRSIHSSKLLERQLSDFLVKDDVADNQNIQYLMNSMVYQTTRLNITLMMTMRCNFKCIYCFESWIPGEERCKELDEEEVINWIIWLVKKYHFRQVDLCFHGGEPLLEIKKIERIAKKLKSFFLANGVFYLFTIVTNGYLLNKINTESFVLTPDKTIYKCISGVGNDAFKLCTLKIGDDPFVVQPQFIENGKDNDCQQCAYMPICNRFCLYESFVMNCNKICKKAYWSEFLRLFFSMYLKSENKNNFVLNPSAEDWEICYHE